MFYQFDNNGLSAAFCDGLYITEEKLQKHNPQGRALKIQLFDTGQQTWISFDFYPLSASRLGFDYAIYGLGQIGVQLGCRRLSGLPFLMLCQSKTAFMQTFTSRLQNLRGLSSSCLLM